MSFRVKFTKDLDWPIVFDDGISPFTGKAKGFRIKQCNCFTNVVKKSKHEFEAFDGFWVDASAALTDADGIVTFS
jgi:hypothetical protein